jgi:hypothetical protein
MNQRSSPNQYRADRDEPLPAGVTALAVALAVVSFAFLLAPLF